MARKSEQTASPIRNFTLTTAERVGAIVTGLPAWARRRKRIEDLFTLIAVAHREGRTREAKKKLAELTSLVDAHNAYYPIEANLPLDPETSRLMDGGEPWKPMPRPTLESILAAAEPKEAPSSLAWSDARGALSVTFDVKDERFTLRLDDEALSCDAISVATCDIEELRVADGFFEAVTFDNETVRFPFRLDPALLDVIVTELGARLRATRAETTDYRGNR